MDSEDKNCAREEIKCLYNWKNNPHPYLLKMYNYFEDNQRLYLVTELCDGADLFE